MIFIIPYYIVQLIASNWSDILSLAIGTAVGGFASGWALTSFNKKRLQAEKDYQKRIEQKKQQAIKQAFKRSIISRNWRILDSLHEQAFNIRLIKDDSREEINQSYEKQKGLVQRFHKSFENELKRECDNLVAQPQSLNIIRSAKTFILLVECLQDVKREYRNEISYLRDEFDELELILNFKKTISLNFEYIYNIQNENQLIVEKYEELGKAIAESENQLIVEKYEELGKAIAESENQLITKDYEEEDRVIMGDSIQRIANSWVKLGKAKKENRLEQYEELGRAIIDGKDYLIAKNYESLGRSLVTVIRHTCIIVYEKLIDWSKLIYKSSKCYNKNNHGKHRQ